MFSNLLQSKCLTCGSCTDAAAATNLAHASSTGPSGCHHPLLAQGFGRFQWTVAGCSSVAAGAWEDGQSDTAVAIRDGSDSWRRLFGSAVAIATAVIGRASLTCGNRPLRSSRFLHLLRASDGGARRCHGGRHRHVA